MSEVRFLNAGEAAQASPEIWATCPKSALNDRATGYFVDQDFVNVTTLPGLISVSDADTVFAFAANQSHTLDMETDGDDNDGASITTRPLGKVIRNGFGKVWFETRVALEALTDQAAFVGIATLGALSQDIVADNPGANAQAAVIDKSLIGFVTAQTTGNGTVRWDAIYRKEGSAAVTVLADVTNALAIPLAERADLAAEGFVKLGLVSDSNRNRVRFVVNGYTVAEIDIDGTVDQSADYGGIVALKTGAIADRTAWVDFFRAAAEVRP